MKKSLMILASVALGASMAAAVDVESKNVVGFNTVSLPVAKYAPLGWQFALVGGDTNVPIASITNYANPTFGLGFASSDGLRRFVSATSKYVDYYRNELGWMKGAEEEVVTTDCLVPGEMVMFIKRTVGSDITEAGEVLGVDVLIPVPAGQYRAMCNPFPIETPVASITNYANPTFGLGFASSDGLRRFDSATSKYIDYYRNEIGWMKGAEEEIVTTDSLAPGEGFMFIKRTTASTITFETPLN